MEPIILSFVYLISNMLFGFTIKYPNDSLVSHLYDFMPISWSNLLNLLNSRVFIFPN